MNKNLFRHVFSKKFGMLVAVAETALANGKAASGESCGTSGAGSVGRFSALASFSFALATAFAGTQLMAPNAFAQGLPTGVGGTLNNVIVGGAAQGSISTSGNSMTLTQNNAVMTANWQSFNIGAGNTVRFIQPTSQSVAVNRVLGDNRSEIFGNLQANGQVFLINPNGVLMGATAQVQVGSLVASTKNITDADIAAGSTSGQWRFANSSLASLGEVVVQSGASIKALGAGTAVNPNGGYIVLHADRVTNDGRIEAMGGRIVLAAGQSLGLTLNNGQLVNVDVTGDVANALVKNGGLIVSDGGQVLLTAKGRNSLMSTVVNNTGVIRARSMTSKNGVIVLDGGAGDVLTNGTIDASGGTGQSGGTVILSGDRVAVLDGAVIDASGDTGGGRVVIGGDSLNKVTDVMAVQFANHTVVQANATIHAGTNSGTGGFVETSGKMLQMVGKVQGKGANWLIDPTDIQITGPSDVNIINSSGTFSGGNNNSATITAATINNALNSGTNVTITTASGGGASNGGSISTNNGAGADIVYTGASSASLTLLSNTTMSLRNNYTATGTGALNLNFSTFSGGAASVFFEGSDQSINTNGGALMVRGAFIAGGPGRHGVSFQSTGSMTVRMGEGSSITGSAGNGAGVSVGSTTHFITTGNTTITGSSQNNHGLLFSGTLSNSGNASLVGVSTIASIPPTQLYGVLFNGTLNTSSGSNTLMLGTAGQYAGVNFIPASVVSSAGNLTLSGSSGGGATGIDFLTNAWTIAAGDSLTLLGTSLSGKGIRLASQSFENAGELNINGNGPSLGVLLENVNINSTAAAHTTVVGTSSNDVGLQIHNSNIELGSNSRLAGNATTAQQGVNLVGSTVVVKGSNNSISGTAGASGSKDGVIFDSNSVLTVNADASLVLIGTALGILPGVTFAAGSVVNNSGNLSIYGRSLDTSGSGDAVGVAILGSYNTTATSRTLIEGTSSVQAGVNFSPSTITSMAGNTSIAGSSGADFGIKHNLGSIDVAAGDSLTLIGSSCAAAGLSLTRLTFNNNGGRLVLQGYTNATSTTGLDLASAVLTSAVGSTTVITGTSANDNSGVGVDMTATDLTVAGNLSISGLSSGRAGGNHGVYIGGAGTYDFAASSNILIQGTSSNGNGVSYAVGLTNRSNTYDGNITIAGSSSRRSGIEFGTSQLSTGSTGKLLVIGSSNTAIGLQLNSMTLDNAGNTSLLGFSGVAGVHGIQINDSALTNRQDANLLISGTATTGVGVVLQTNTFDFGGNVTVSGVNDTDTRGGVNMQGNTYSWNDARNTLIKGSSNAGVGIDFQDNLGGTTIAHNMTIAGSSRDEYGLAIDGSTGMGFSGMRVAAGGVLMLQGSSQTGHGITMSGAEFTNDGTLHIAGYTNATTTGSQGVYIKGSSTLSNGADAHLVITGTSNVGAGVISDGNTLNFGGNVTIQGITDMGTDGGVHLANNSYDWSRARNTLIAGSSNEGIGIVIKDNWRATIDHNVIIVGSSREQDGLRIEAGAGLSTLTISQTGSLTLAGSSSGKNALYLADVTINNSGNVSLLGFTSRAMGGAPSVNIHNTQINNDATATLLVSGTANSGLGVVIRNSQLNLGGNATILGSSNSANGVRMSDNTYDFRDASQTRIEGTSTALQGVLFSNDLSGTGIAHNLTIAGSSRDRNGLEFTSSTRFTLQGGSLTLVGSSQNNRGLDAIGGLQIDNTDGSVALYGVSNSTNSGHAGLRLDGFTYNPSGATNTTLVGSGNAGTGIEFGATPMCLSVTTGSRLYISGSSNDGAGISGLPTSGPVSVDRDADLTILGTSNAASQGIVIGTLAFSVDGNLTLSGSSRSNRALDFTGSLSSTLGSNVYLSGVSNTDRGLNFVPSFADFGGNTTMVGYTNSTGSYGGVMLGAEFTTSASSNLLVQGSAGGASAVGVYVYAGLNLAGNTTVIGSAEGAIGVYIQGGTLNVSSTGQLLINGSSNASNGILITPGVQFTSQLGGNISLLGSSQSSAGVYSDSALNLSGALGYTLVSGSSNQSYGVRIRDSSGDPMTISSGAVAHIVGTSQNGTGVRIESNITNAGTLNITGVAVNGTFDAIGVDISNSFFNTTSTGISRIDGVSKNSFGVLVVGSDSLGVDSGGLLVISGSSDADLGAVISQNTITNQGNFSVQGSSNAGAGTYFSVTTFTDIAGSYTNIRGTSNTGAGIQFVDENAGVNGIGLTVQGNMQIRGSSNTGVGILGLGNDGNGNPLAITVASTGSLYVAGSSQTQIGLDLTNTNYTNNGNLTLAGYSEGSTGLRGSGSFSLVSAANTNTVLTGTSNTSGEGVSLTTTSGTFTVGGNLTIAGSSYNSRATNLVLGDLQVLAGTTTLITGTSNLDRGVTLDVNSISNAGNLTIDGIGNLSGVGINSGSAFTDFANANTTIIGTGNLQAGVSLSRGFTDLIVNGKMLMAGSANTASGVTGFSNFTVASTGDLTVQGSSQTAIGLDLTQSTITNSGNLTLGGYAVTQNGIELSGTDYRFDASNARNTVITGTSNSGTGVNIVIPTSAQSWHLGGNTTIAGSSDSGQGVLLDGDLNSHAGGMNVAAGARLHVLGRSNTESAVYVHKLRLNNDGNVSISGSSLSGNGVYVYASTVTNGANANLSLVGSSVDGAGVSTNGMRAHLSGNTLISGTSTAGNGVSISGSILNLTASARMVVQGSSDIENGVGIESTTVNNAGNLTLRGTSNGSNGGVFFNDSHLNNAVGAIANFNGTAASGTGVVFKSGTLVNDGTLLASGSAGGYGVVFNSQTSLNTSAGSQTIISGNGSTDAGVWIDASLGWNLLGNTTVSGTTVGIGQQGVQISNGVLDVGTGALLRVAGSSTAGNGVLLQDLELRNAGNVSVYGNSSSTAGIKFSTITINSTATSNLSLIGTSTTATGVLLQDMSNVTFGANTLVAGSSADDIGVTLRGVSDLRIENGQNVTITGSSVTEKGVAFALPSNITNNGTLRISGNSTSSDGVFFSSDVRVMAGTNSLTVINGNSTDGNGVTIALAAEWVMQGNATIRGTSRTEKGVELSNGNLLSGVIGASQLLIEGSSNSNYGVFLDTAGLRSPGNTTINGQSIGSAGVFVQSGQIANTATSNFTITGTSDNGMGIDLSPNTLTFGANTLLFGISNQSTSISYNPSTLGAININAGSNVTIVGSSNQFHGLYFDRSIINAGNLTLTGYSAGLSGANDGINLLDSTLTTSSNSQTVLSGTAGGNGRGVLLTGSYGTHRFDGNVTMSGVSNASAGGQGVSIQTVENNANLHITTNTGLELPGGPTGTGNTTATAEGDIYTISGSYIKQHNLSLLARGNISLANTIGASDQNISGIFNANSTGGYVNYSQAAPLQLGNIAAANYVTIASASNLTVNNAIRAGNNITLIAGDGSVAGTNVTDGMVIIANSTASIITANTAGAGGTSIIYSGSPTNTSVNYNTAAYRVATGATAETTAKTYNVDSTDGAGTVNASRVLNVFYRVAPTVTVTASNQTKLYDGTTNANTSKFTATGLLDDDTAETAITSVAMAYNQSAAGTGLNVNISSVTANTSYLSGYTIVTANSSNSAIDRAVVIVTSNGTVNSKLYDTTANASTYGQNYTVVMGNASNIGGTITLTGNTSVAYGIANFTAADAGTKTINLTHTVTDSTNYTFVAGSNNATQTFNLLGNGTSATVGSIERAVVTVTGNGTVNSKLFDTTANASTYGQSYNLTLGDSSVANISSSVGNITTVNNGSASATANFTSALAGTSTVNITHSVSDTANYTFVPGSGGGTANTTLVFNNVANGTSATVGKIERAVVTVTGNGTVNSKLFDTTANASTFGQTYNVTLGNSLVANMAASNGNITTTGNMSVASAIANFTGSSVGTNTANLTHTVADAANFTFVAGASNTTQTFTNVANGSTANIGTIHQAIATITGNGTVADKAYDGTTNATLLTGPTGTLLMGNSAVANLSAPTGNITTTLIAAGNISTAAIFTNSSVGTQAVNLTYSSTNFALSRTLGTTSANITSTNVTPPPAPPTPPAPPPTPNTTTPVQPSDELLNRISMQQTEVAQRLNLAPFGLMLRDSEHLLKIDYFDPVGVVDTSSSFVPINDKITKIDHVYCVDGGVKTAGFIKPDLEFCGPTPTPLNLRVKPQ